VKRKSREALKALSAPELQSEIKKRREELLRMAMQKPFRSVKNPLRERIVRRETAMLLTWLKEKEKSEVSHA